MKKYFLAIFFLIIQVQSNGEVKAAEAASSKPVPSPGTAIFLINNAGSEYDQFVPTIKDNLTSLLTQKGFSIVRSENAMLPRGLPDSNENKITDPQAESSLNRLAESLNAGLLIVSTINAVTHDENTFDGTGTSYNVVKTTAIDTVRINLQIFDVGTTKSVYGDSVNTSLRTPVYGQAQTRTILINLFHDASARIAENISKKVVTINASATVSNKAKFSITTNIPSVDVFIDGVVVGSVGDSTKLQTTPGLHQLKLGKEFIKSWEKTVNITDGAKFNVALELSNDGVSRYQNVEKFNLAMKAADNAIESAKLNSSGVINDKAMRSQDRIINSEFGNNINTELEKKQPSQQSASTANNLKQPSSESNDINEVSFTKDGGVYLIPVVLNDVLNIKFIIDTGAAEVTISPDIAAMLYKTGTITAKDFLPGAIYQLADGSTVESDRFILKSIKIGKQQIKNVTCSISNSINAPMLLGQSALELLGTYTFDYPNSVVKFYKKQ
jgi:predicted aspartyl protease